MTAAHQQCQRLHRLDVSGGRDRYGRCAQCAKAAADRTNQRDRDRAKQAKAAARLREATRLPPPRPADTSTVVERAVAFRAKHFARAGAYEVDVAKLARYVAGQFADLSDLCAADPSTTAGARASIEAIGAAIALAEFLEVQNPTTAPTK